MGDTGPSYKLQKTRFSFKSHCLLKQLEVQWVIREKIIVVHRVGDI